MALRLVASPDPDPDDGPWLIEEPESVINARYLVDIERGDVPRCSPQEALDGLTRDEVIEVCAVLATWAAARPGRAGGE